MTDRIELRRSLPVDLPRIAHIEAASFSDPWPEDSLLTELRTDRMRRPLSALRNGEVVGYLMAWKVADEWHVINLAVATGERRSGIGTLLLEATLAAAVAEGCRTATLEVRVGNEPALAFYARHGFESIERRPQYYRDTGEDALVLIRLLAATDR
ncbi:ribosomal protein S18-alanine N-acetyltransferase [bacterium]|nr:ribosomal protein S18-alanine N-acetyltransferase [bacterium]MBU1675869.1 ribosomal protein S18-alanine N-acetyltransferase [bacterium]